MIITGDDPMGISSLQQFLHRQFKMKDLDFLSYFLGLEISQDSSSYFLTQAKYTSDLLARASLTDCKIATTPVDPQTRLTPLEGTLFHGLHYFAQSSLQLHAFSDANWAGDPTDRCSTTRFCFFLGNYLIT
ncbi:uncharacterized protein LOC114322779 [Camellia sinensis]|uniref:uncharacterized protein LOC114322779 n=1 Tax=Camellia sinensis TaxID=4442 RepID=UPI00103624C2|nr:uncharacterized protein LOC114322779 [Camellia sinensis]